MRDKIKRYRRGLSLLLTLAVVSCASTPARHFRSERQGNALDLLGRRERGTALLALAAAGPVPAAAGGPAPAFPSSRGTTELRSAVGFTIDPETFLMSGEGGYFVRDNLAVGPLLQLGLSDRRVIVAPTANVRGVFDLPGGEWERLKPFAQGGLGFAYINRERNGDDDDLGFLLNFGFGADYTITERFALGNSVLFNIMPDKVRGENFFFSWQFVTASFRF